MAKIRAFRGFRPVPEKVTEVASPPYDVVNTAEAAALAEGKPLSFLHVVRPEIDLPAGTDPYDSVVYETAAANLGRLMSEGVLRQDERPCLYAYRQQMGAHVQTGLVAAASVADYDADVIKKHEHTRRVKEDDRTRHVATCNANAGPVFLTYRAREVVDTLIQQATAAAPTYDFEAYNGTRHTLWVISDPELVAGLEAAFADIPALYVADGHHRSASAARVGRERRSAKPNATGEEAFNFFLAVLFPDDQLRIMDYNRVVRDLNGRSVDEFMAAVAEAGFTLTPVGDRAGASPRARNEFGMYVDGRWFRLGFSPAADEASHPVKGLDVSLLQEHLLRPVLGIEDPRSDERIDFVGGIRGLDELERRVQAGWAVAFALHPTSVAELMAIADAGAVMPPKSTWFEPKLLSGMVVHTLDD